MGEQREISGPLAVFLVSLVPLPLCYILNHQTWIENPVVVLCVGVVVLTLITVGPYLAITRMKKPDFILKALGIFILSSGVDMFVSMEADGITPEIITFYVKDGEPYLWTAHGTMICYWDGFTHYAIYLWILYCIVTGRSYRKVGLFVVGSIINSVIVIFMSTATGTIGMHPSTALNIPYLFVPVWITYRLLNDRSHDNEAITSSDVPIWKRPMDALMIVYFLFASTMDMFRGLIALGSQVDLLQEYLHDYEPYILDPVAFPKSQMIVYMMYFVPYYACAIYGLLNPGQKWLPDWAMFFAGASAQAQFSHIGASFHWRTDPEFHVPARSHSRMVFWIVNIILFAGPQIFALLQNFTTKTTPASIKKKRS